jgi:TRAP-type mannitol/chloroaromatic compound transport system permease large subunit
LLADRLEACRQRRARRSDLHALAHPDKTPPADPPMPFKQKIRESLNLIPCLLLITMVFLSLLLGWATATECAAWGVLGSLAIAWPLPSR